ncbi:hypothetical protein CRN61_19240 [Vibrio vulnificus]|nr:hypothetical protein CRN61_19240 [Vibrio vulnificus]
MDSIKPKNGIYAGTGRITELPDGLKASIAASTPVRTSGRIRMASGSNFQPYLTRLNSASASAKASYRGGV